MLDPALAPPASSTARTNAGQVLLGLGVAAKKALPGLYRETRAVSDFSLCAVAFVLDGLRDLLEAVGIPVGIKDIWFAGVTGLAVYKWRTEIFACIAYIWEAVKGLGPQLFIFVATMDPWYRNNALPFLRAFRFIVASFFPKHKAAMDAFAGDVEEGLGQQF